MLYDFKHHEDDGLKRLVARAAEEIAAFHKTATEALAVNVDIHLTSKYHKKPWT